MKKALLVATVSGFVPQFEMNNVKLLQSLGYQIHYATNYNMPSYGTDNSRLEGTGIIKHQIDFIRNPYKLHNFKVYKQLKKVMESEQFELVHCHTPMGAVVARLASHSTNTYPVIYTAHGFHFYKGARLRNWLIYYPVERFLSRYTDQLICLNEEDYLRATHFSARYVDQIPSVGIDFDFVRKLTEEEIVRKKEELGIPLDKKIMLSVGELIPRKNHETILRALSIRKKFPEIYVICGHGELENYLKRLIIELDIKEKVYFLGYRKDVWEIYHLADCFVFPSHQEGLPMALLEAMACGLPVICTDIRGNRDLMGDKKLTSETYFICEGGISVKKSSDIHTFVYATELMFANDTVRENYGIRNQEVAKEYSLNRVEDKMMDIYRRVIENRHEKR